ncbi:MAG: hypothetical protein OXB95_12020 [Rhodobacteraceae bacterium]|nr:hypothetical protein [Paracoccaceae bacterium]
MAASADSSANGLATATLSMAPFPNGEGSNILAAAEVRDQLPPIIAGQSAIHGAGWKRRRKVAAATEDSASFIFAVEAGYAFDISIRTWAE